MSHHIAHKSYSSYDRNQRYFVQTPGVRFTSLIAIDKFIFTLHLREATVFGVSLLTSHDPSIYFEELRVYYEETGVYSEETGLYSEETGVYSEETGGGAELEQSFFSTLSINHGSICLCFSQI